ncbi:hypothetical protein [Hymenobacter weizhouensis]|uniref:hypothetical protein n=1 Tax=Hymenobacter sp. YIM 151500-1 TaxID=2987689 RepID=UPI0022263D63|nr:hypothetical protein [Hymenobacter sp. YIM 151500-1]UYZ64814.1 hypothetical protein OIS53_08175 [Hymenobacter sp. YIM 151500-1]
MKLSSSLWKLLVAGLLTACTAAPPASRGRTLSPDHEVGEPRNMPPGALDTTAADTVR